MSLVCRPSSTSGFAPAVALFGRTVTVRKTMDFVRVDCSERPHVQLRAEAGSCSLSSCLSAAGATDGPRRTLLLRPGTAGLVEGTRLDPLTRPTLAHHPRLPLLVGFRQAGGSAQPAHDLADLAHVGQDRGVRASTQGGRHEPLRS